MIGMTQILLILLTFLCLGEANELLNKLKEGRNLEDVCVTVSDSKWYTRTNTCYHLTEVRGNIDQAYAECDKYKVQNLSSRVLNIYDQNLFDFIAEENSENWEKNDIWTGLHKVGQGRQYWFTKANEPNFNAWKYDASIPIYVSNDDEYCFRFHIGQSKLLDMRCTENYDIVCEIFGEGICMNSVVNKIAKCVEDDKCKGAQPPCSNQMICIPEPNNHRCVCPQGKSKTSSGECRDDTFEQSCQKDPNAVLYSDNKACYHSIGEISSKLAAYNSCQNFVASNVISRLPNVYNQTLINFLAFSNGIWQLSYYKRIWLGLQKPEGWYKLFWQTEFNNNDFNTWIDYDGSQYESTLSSSDFECYVIIRRLSYQYRIEGSSCTNTYQNYAVCETFEDLCQSISCPSGQICIPEPSNFRCICPAGQSKFSNGICFDDTLKESCQKTAMAAWFSENEACYLITGKSDDKVTSEGLCESEYRMGDHLSRLPNVYNQDVLDFLTGSNDKWGGKLDMDLWTGAREYMNKGMIYWLNSPHIDNRNSWIEYNSSNYKNALIDESNVGAEDYCYILKTVNIGYEKRFYDESCDRQNPIVCEIFRDACKLNPCNDTKTCISDPGTYRCVCPSHESEDQHGNCLEDTLAQSCQKNPRAVWYSLNQVCYRFTSVISNKELAYDKCEEYEQGNVTSRLPNAYNQELLDFVAFQNGMWELAGDKGIWLGLSKPRDWNKLFWQTEFNNNGLNTWIFFNESQFDNSPTNISANCYTIQKVSPSTYKIDGLSCDNDNFAVCETFENLCKSDSCALNLICIPEPREFRCVCPEGQSKISNGNCFEDDLENTCKKSPNSVWYETNRACYNMTKTTGNKTEALETCEAMESGSLISRLPQIYNSKQWEFMVTDNGKHEDYSDSWTGLTKFSFDNNFTNLVWNNANAEIIFNQSSGISINSVFDSQKCFHISTEKNLLEDTGCWTTRRVLCELFENLCINRSCPLGQICVPDPGNSRCLCPANTTFNEQDKICEPKCLEHCYNLTKCVTRPDGNQCECPFPSSWKYWPECFGECEHGFRVKGRQIDEFCDQKNQFEYSSCKITRSCVQPVHIGEYKEGLLEELKKECDIESGLFLGSWCVVVKLFIPENSVSWANAFEICQNSNMEMMHFYDGEFTLSAVIAHLLSQDQHSNMNFWVALKSVKRLSNWMIDSETVDHLALINSEPGRNEDLCLSVGAYKKNNITTPTKKMWHKCDTQTNEVKGVLCMQKTTYNMYFLHKHLEVQTHPEFKIGGNKEGLNRFECMAKCNEKRHCLSYNFANQTVCELFKISARMRESIVRGRKLFNITRNSNIDSWHRYFH